VLQHATCLCLDVQVVALFIVMAFSESDVTKDKRRGVKDE
jgi:hypothetical protein